MWHWLLKWKTTTGSNRVKSAPRTQLNQVHTVVRVMMMTVQH